MKNGFLLLCLLIITQEFSAQQSHINDQWKNSFWNAWWIDCPNAPEREFGVYHLRKTFELASRPEQFIIHVSADNRYKLFVNGEEVGLGPARGDIQHWRFETYDIASFLKSGDNIIAVVVWNFASHAPVAQISQQTAFILQGDSEREAVVNTDQSWKIMQNQAIKPETESLRSLNSYLVVGPGEIIDGSIYPWEWKSLIYNDNQWQQAHQIVKGQAFGRGTDGNWLLIPREIPTMDKYELAQPLVRRTEGLDSQSTGIEDIRIPANTTATILLDQKELVTAYPHFTFSEGKGAEVRIQYSEALFNKQNQKTNRNEIETKVVKGYADFFYPDGGSSRTFSPLWFRTWRYLEITVSTKNSALTLNNFKAYFTGYPFEQKANFQSDLPWLSDVWDVGWRTARLCAGETYYDCPYYEQLQYVGDTRIQALISLYVAGDDRLMKKAINDFDQSRIWNGLTQSRYPCSRMQLIPTYSLFWISMIHDYWMHRPDEEYVRSLLPGIQSVLQWYEKQINENGLLGRMKWWHFTDWTNEWRWNEIDRIGGVPEQDENGNNSILALQYAYTLEQAAELHAAFGDMHFANKYARLKKEVIQAVNQNHWDPEREMYAELPDKNSFSQHANIFAILADALPQTPQKALMEKIVSEPDLIQATFYFKFYLFRALQKTGMADQYIQLLQPWKEMLDLGLTTFAEKPDPTRSDCHAWSASPNYDLLATVVGIQPASPGFKTVLIQPSLGQLTNVSADMPHPNGMIHVDLTKMDNRLKASVQLPSGLKGVFRWNGNQIILNEGENNLEVPAG